MGGEGEGENVALLAELPKASDESEGNRKRTGTSWTAIAYIITAVIGAGVLSLAWSVAQLGWIAGPIAIMFFAAVTMLQSHLLADCYRSPDPEHGHIRNHSYMEAVKLNLENGRIKGGTGGIAVASTAQKVWRASQALGDIAFAYPYSIILLEIEDTLKSPPPENQTMKKASTISILLTTFFYLCCGCFGYAAFGNDTPGNLLTGFGFYEPYWLVDFANACIVVHLVGGYQVFSQPVFSFLDGWSSDKFPTNGFVNKFYTIRLPFLPPYRLNLFRLCYRTIYVASTTGIAMLFPYFNQVLGLLGAFNFWPLAIYFPVEMYFVQRKIGAWTKKWVALQIFSAVCLLVSMFALVGSIEGLVSQKLS
ncbi:putative amino acid permease 7 [Cocos nucifera]|uniref:Putative amino acid permease 7 n=1 Tax=Cocos nucifera TaxID=13894 RepID=A0A8K0IPM1_COCNU|nr:putative amino acid permease 7 [Cocos nucifera]